MKKKNQDFAKWFDDKKFEDIFKIIIKLFFTN